MGIKEFMHYVGWLVLVVLAICLAAALGYWGPWYFAWAVGTVMTVLVAAFAGVLYDREAREEEAEAAETEH